VLKQISRSNIVILDHLMSFKYSGVVKISNRVQFTTLIGCTLRKLQPEV